MPHVLVNHLPLSRRLEALLEEKLSLVERLGNGNKGFAAAQLRTDAFRQVRAPAPPPPPQAHLGCSAAWVVLWLPALSHACHTSLADCASTSSPPNT